MATIGTAVTLQDLARRLDANGKVDKVVEILNQTNEVLDDMMWVEGNLPTGHKTTVRTGLPTSTWRKLNYGVQPSKSKTAQVTDAIGMLENYAEVDKSLADLNGNSAAFRLSEDQAFIESMNQDMASTLFYGDTDVNPERFTGLAARYAASGTDMTKISYNVIKGAHASGGSASTSIWLVVWGPNTVHGIYPKGSQAGFQINDKGQQTLVDDAGGKYEGYRTHYKWDCGLSLRDWRYVVRISNIDVANLTKNAATGDDLVDLMVQAIERIPSLGMGRPVFYCNGTIRSFLRRQLTAKVANSTLSMADVGGKQVLMVGEVPVKKCDQILNTEAGL